MRIPIQINGLETDPLQKFSSHFPSFVSGHVFCGPEGFGDYGIHLHTGVKTGVRVLKYNLYSLSHELHLRPTQVGVVLTFKFKTSPGEVQQPENQLAKGGLPASRFTHQTKVLAPFDSERDAINSPNPATRSGKQTTPQGKMFDQIAGCQQWRFMHGSSSVPDNP